MKKIIIFLSALFLLSLPMIGLAEEKMQIQDDSGDGYYSEIPKLTDEETKDAPILTEGKVYPFWGPVCQRYTYSVIYRDEQGRKPEYVKIGTVLKMNDFLA